MARYRTFKCELRLIEDEPLQSSRLSVADALEGLAKDIRSGKGQLECTVSSSASILGGYAKIYRKEIQDKRK